MRRLTENLNPEDRRFYWKFVGGLCAFYGALTVVMVGMFVANHVSKNLPLESAMAQAISHKLPAAIEVPVPHARGKI
jgi:hypothetical protein